MTAATIHSDFGAQENKICHCLHFFHFYLQWSDGTGWHDLITFFLMLSFKPVFSCSSFIIINRLFSSSSISVISVVSSVHLRFLIFLQIIFILASDSSGLAFYMMYSANKLNKQGDNTHPWWTPFPILNWSIVPYSVLTVAFWSMYRFLRRQVRCSGILISLGIFHT